MYMHPFPSILLLLPLLSLSPFMWIWFYTLGFLKHCFRKVWIEWVWSLCPSLPGGHQQSSLGDSDLPQPNTLSFCSFTSCPCKSRTDNPASWREPLSPLVFSSRKDSQCSSSFAFCNLSWLRRTSRDRRTSAQTPDDGIKLFCVTHVSRS